MTAREYIEIEVDDGFLEKFLEKYELVDITSPSTSFFNACSILPIDTGVAIEQQGDTLGSGSSWWREELWQNVRGARKLRGGYNDKAEGGGMGENEFADKKFLCEIQWVGNRSSVNLVNSVNI